MVDERSSDKGEPDERVEPDEPVACEPVADGAEPGIEPEPVLDDADEPDVRGDDADDADVRDVLPDDLDVSGYVGPYVFPNNNRRRVPGYLYIGLAVVCIALWFTTRDHAPVLVNGGMLWAALALALIGAYHQVAGWNLDVDEQDALVESTRTVGFAVGHASAQLGWRGLLSRPTWRILLYSAENPPKKRGLVLIDGVDGEVIDHFVEDNPEDWSELDGSLTS